MNDSKMQKLVTAAFVLLLGCGGSSTAPAASPANQPRENSGGENIPKQAVHREGHDSVTAHLGPPGGTLELTGGPRVEIPSGALEGGEDFVLKIAPKTTAFLNKESEQAVGPTFSFSPDVQAQEGRPILVSLPLASFPEGWGEPAIAYEISQGAIAHGEDSTRTKWQYENARQSGGRLVAELPTLHGLRMQFVLSNLNAQ